ncbi:Hypothetical protein MALK_6610 [Metamycoplasma alkalescens 14918]|uniref:Uncharacterized protein n=1 Tax=Metamycoplasma alkalescens 14918 TaxID=1188234 RepID=N9U9M9_9BACT|nr:hypothetical protein [Metamycoplasma alkalescens]ENY53633.1 Hypothetical protein MALK_6610 [Metamycoplasma alkalescens 14918]
MNDKNLKKEQVETKLSNDLLEIIKQSRLNDYLKYTKENITNEELKDALKNPSIIETFAETLKHIQNKEKEHKILDFNWDSSKNKDIDNEISKKNNNEFVDFITNKIDEILIEIENTKKKGDFENEYD